MSILIHIWQLALGHRYTLLLKTIGAFQNCPSRRPLDRGSRHAISKMPLALRYIDRFQTTLSLTPGASTRARKRSSAQDATKFNGAIQPIIYRCHEFSLQRIDLAITSGSSHWPISSSHRSRKAHVIAVKVYRDPAGQTEVFVPVSLLQTFI